MIKPNQWLSIYIYIFFLFVQFVHFFIKIFEKHERAVQKSFHAPEGGGG